MISLAVMLRYLAIIHNRRSVGKYKVVSKSAWVCYNRSMRTQRSISVGSPTLIGRAGQLALLTDLLAQACEGQGRVALIAGEAGIGKSRLIAEVAALAAARGARSLQGRCFEQDRALPYAPLIDWLRAFCSAQPAQALLPSLGMALAELIKISPELAAALPDLAPAPALEPAQEKRRLFQACSRFSSSSPR